MHTNPKLFTSSDIESHGCSVFTPKVFYKIPIGGLGSKGALCVQHTTEMDGRKIVYVVENSRRVTHVIFSITDHIYKCSCMLFESIGIPCHHICELPLQYITQRWTKNVEGTPCTKAMR
jgi:hypothetical protein